MKTKSYNIYTGDTTRSDYVTVSETIGLEKIKLSISGGGVILLDHDAWDELCGMKYELKCNKSYPAEQAEIFDEPKLSLPTDELKKEIETNDRTEEA